MPFPAPPLKHGYARGTPGNRRPPTAENRLSKATWVTPELKLKAGADNPVGRRGKGVKDMLEDGRLGALSESFIWLVAAK